MKLATRIFRKERGTASNQYYITSPFGWRKDPKTGEKKFHAGCDYGTHGNKWPQYALEDGVVESKYKDKYGALVVVIAYSRLGIKLTHAHLDSISVNKGQSVNSNTILGYTGKTGYATGIHLHLGVQKIGSTSWIDPESIDYEPGPTPPTPTGYPWLGVVLKGSPLYNINGVKYKNNAARDRNVEVKREVNGRYEVKCEYFSPSIVYVDKKNVIKKSIYPFEGMIKKGTNLYAANGNKYKYSCKANRLVTVQGELNGRYKIYCEAFSPKTVYVNKGDVIRR